MPAVARALHEFEAAGHGRRRSAGNTQHDPFSMSGALEVQIMENRSDAQPALWGWYRL